MKRMYVLNIPTNIKIKRYENAFSAFSRVPFFCFFKDFEDFFDEKLIFKVFKVE